VGQLHTAACSGLDSSPHVLKLNPLAPSITRPRTSSKHHPRSRPRQFRVAHTIQSAARHQQYLGSCLHILPVNLASTSVTLPSSHTIHHGFEKASTRLGAAPERPPPTPADLRRTCRRVTSCHRSPHVRRNPGGPDHDVHAPPTTASSSSLFMSVIKASTQAVGHHPEHSTQ